MGKEMDLNSNEKERIREANAGQYWERKGVTKEELLKVGEKHQFLVDKILECKPKRVLEIGCGRGVIAVMVSHGGCEVTAIDKDPVCIAEGKETNRFLEGNVTFVEADAFNYRWAKGYDVVFSQEFLHRFSPSKLKRLMSKYTKIAEMNVHSVPSENWPALAISYNVWDENEKFLTKSQWGKKLVEYKPEIEYYSHFLEGVYEGKVYEDVSLCISIRKK